MKKNIIKTFVVVFIININSVSSYAETLFSAHSPDFENEGVIPDKYTYNSFGCVGENVAPVIRWDNPPENVKSFAITIYDVDAPSISGWWHATVFDIPTNISEINLNEPLPEGAKFGRNDYGYDGYGGPCPPIGDTPHRYEISVWALKTESLKIPESSPGGKVGFMLNLNAIEKKTFSGLYSR